MSERLNDLYVEAQEIAKRNGWGDGVRKWIRWPVSVEDIPWAYCLALVDFVFFEFLTAGKKFPLELCSWHIRVEDYAVATGRMKKESEPVYGLAAFIKENGIPGHLIRVE